VQQRGTPELGISGMPDHLSAVGFSPRRLIPHHNSFEQRRATTKLSNAHRAFLPYKQTEKVFAMDRNIKNISKVAELFGSAARRSCNDAEPRW
jgi:hypothetical protein